MDHTKLETNCGCVSLIEDLELRLNRQSRTIGLQRLKLRELNQKVAEYEKRLKQKPHDI